jgi:hypothetical protein
MCTPCTRRNAAKSGSTAAKDIEAYQQLLQNADAMSYWSRKNHAQADKHRSCDYPKLNRPAIRVYKAPLIGFTYESQQVVDVDLV